MATQIISTTPDSEIVISRVVNATIKIAYEAWANPNHLKNWWGPAGFTNSFNEFDFKVGDKWSFIMHELDKGNYTNECKFIKIEEPNLIAWERHSQTLFQVLTTFEEVEGGKTIVVFKMLFNTAEECSKLKKFVIDRNEENFDKLEIELTKMIP